MVHNELPSGWKLKKLAEICEVKKGELITKRTLTEGNIPVIAGGKSPAYYHNKANRQGEVVTVSASGAYAGYVNFFSIPIFVSDCTAIQSLDQKVILTKYVFYYLKNQQDRIYRFQTGSGQPHVYPKDLAKMEIPVPPLLIQKKVVDILDKKENLKEIRMKTNEDTSKIIQSIFADIFGDPTKNNKKYPIEVLDNVAEKITDGTHVTPNYISEGVPFFRVTDITLSNDSKKYISKEEHQELIKRCKPEKGDVLYTKNGTIGIAKTVDWDYDFSIFVSLCLIKPKKEKILSKYLEVFLNTPFALAQAMQHSKKGTITNLHLVEIKKIKIPIPPISKQKEFLDIVEKVEKIINHQKNSTLEITNLSDALMQRAFKGELII
jgi:type I restriction enzyme S subunit